MLFQSYSAYVLSENPDFRWWATYNVVKFSNLSANIAVAILKFPAANIRKVDVIH